MFYELECTVCGSTYLIRKAMKDAARPEFCDCGLTLRRIYSHYQIHMNTMVADGYKKTTGIPDELKPGVERIQAQKDIISYPGKPAGRKKAIQA